MQKDLHSYLAYLEENYPGELITVDVPVDSKWEIAAVVRRFQEDNKFPALLFKNIINSNMPVVTNLFASRVRLAAAFETTPDKLLLEYIKRENTLLKPELVSNGPVQEVVFTGDQVDVTKLPIVFHAEKDGAPYITPGMTIMKDPDTGVYNSGMYRIMQKGPRKMGISLAPENHGAMIWHKNEQRGQDTEFVVALGHHPAAVLSASSHAPYHIDELEVMGGLLGEPIQVVQCKTVDLLVPAYAEIAIEGRILCGQREPEGPMAEFTWYYGAVRQKPVMEIMAVTHRKDAIFHDLYCPYIEHNLAGMLPGASRVYSHVKDVVPSLIDVCMPEGGLARNVAYLKMKPEYDGQARNGLLAALGSHDYIKIAIAVDEDIDIYNDRQVLWAITTRTQPDRDFFFVPHSHTSRLLPCTYSIDNIYSTDGGMDTKLGIDATKPVALPYAEVSDVKRELWENLDLSRYTKGQGNRGS